MHYNVRWSLREQQVVRPGSGPILLSFIGIPCAPTNPHKLSPCECGSFVVDSRLDTVKTPARTIKASVLVKDLETGLNDLQVMQKHGLQPEQLDYLFYKMMQAGLLTRQQLEARSQLAETNITKAFVEMQQSMDELEEIDDSGFEETQTPEPARPSETDDDAAAYAQTLRAMVQDLEDPAPPPAPPPPERTGRRKIRADDLVRDVTSGMSDPELMERYQLQPKQLEFMLRKLVDAGLVTETQLVERTSITSTSITKAFVDVYQSLRELDED